MPDVQIHPLGDVAAPADYVIAAAAELLLKMAFATFDGSGAAGSFVPCLRIKSDAGTVTGEAVADSTVAVGASADVTWFPNLRPAGGGGIDFDQPNTDPLGAAGELQIDTGVVKVGSIIAADWEVIAVDVFWQTTGPSGYLFEADGGDIDLTSNRLAGHGGGINLEGSSHVALSAGAGTLFEAAAGGVYVMANLPVADPGITGRLWNDLGTLKVSP